LVGAAESSSAADGLTARASAASAIALPIVAFAPMDLLLDGITALSNR
jgi:hypothetical protein